ncbi:MAG: GNAT family N-acetyltransferase [Bdellovibrionota bacterium]
MELRKAASPAELEMVFPVMKELRPHLTFQRYIELIERAAQNDGYEIIAAFDREKCVGAMGFRILFDFVHGKHMYIDDLVVTESHRSKKIGAKLLRHAEDTAREMKCEALRLCTGVENEAGKRFYDREGWTLRAVAYKKKL